MDQAVVATPVGATTDKPSTSRLSGNLGFFELFFTALAFNAPLVVVIGLLPVLIKNGNLTGAPVTLLVAGVIFLFFAVGFTTMGRLLPNPGGFYAYITAGLGKPLGLGSAFIAVACYFCSVGCMYPISGVYLNSLVHDTFGGPSIQWWVYALVLFIATSVLGYFNISVSAKVLTVSLACEVAIVVFYNVMVIGKGGASGHLTATSFHPGAILAGNLGLALMFSLGVFGGFESTIIFRDEVRNPRKTIPRATYAVVIFLALFFALTTWVFIEAYGPGNVVNAIGDDSVAAMESSIKMYAGKTANDIAIVLVNTSSFATMLSAQNIVARYIQNLSADGVLFRKLAAVHPRHKSPHRAAIATSVLVIAALLPMILLGIPPVTMYANLVGVYSYILVALLFITAISVPCYLWRKQRAHATVWNAAITPAVGIIGMGLALVLSTVNLHVLIGDSTGLTVILFVLLFGLLAGGFVLALVYRKRRPEVYARIGREETSEFTRSVPEDKLPHHPHTDHL